MVQQNKTCTTILGSSNAQRHISLWVSRLVLARNASNKTSNTYLPLLRNISQPVVVFDSRWPRHIPTIPELSKPNYDRCFSLRRLRRRSGICVAQSRRRKSARVPARAIENEASGLASATLPSSLFPSMSSPDMPTVTAKFKTQTCVLCRQRKLRCDGETPCSPCTRARTPVVCVYIPRSAGQLRSELPKGAACKPCRQRKRRCDGDLPCRTCKGGSRPDECSYHDKAPGRKSIHAERDRLVAPDGASTCSSRSTAASPPYPPRSPEPLELPADSVQDPTATLDLYLPVPEWPWCFDPSTASQGFPSIADSPASNSVALPSLPYPPQLPETSGFPDTDNAAELFVVRNLFLDHCWNYGLNLSGEKRDALSRGDAVAAPPVLLHLCQLLGYLFTSHSHAGRWHYFPEQSAGEAAEARAVHAILSGGALDADPATALQSHMLLAMYYGIKCDGPAYMEVWTRLSALTLRHLPLITVDETTPMRCPAQLNSESFCPQSPAQELLSTFCEIILLEIGRVLIWKLPPAMAPGVLSRFRALAATQGMGTELNYLRARSLLFMFDANQLVDEYRRYDPSAPSDLFSLTCPLTRNAALPVDAEWSARYWCLIEDIHAHLAEIDTPVFEVSFIHQAQVLTLRISVSTALAALAALHALFAPFQPEARRKRGEAIEHMAAIAGLFYDTDYPYLDATLGAAWETALQPVAGEDWTAQCARVVRALEVIRDCHRRLSEAVPYVPILTV
ncbi:hypothetical protein B0H15DRAFT_472420 [Mycena belliarum]|uniref:Zn(2)-C6 fungal-type domain-containing protein n=1 Tax=Mycena belliarum TaxID=1033014 RepID=A0AAD6U160_9AGAR|nr:hypothetical protein B0H15DRAFT_472420 [Mycena belliae]